MNDSNMASSHVSNSHSSFDASPPVITDITVCYNGRKLGLKSNILIKGSAWFEAWAKDAG
jgi:hypothetical protein